MVSSSPTTVRFCNTCNDAFVCIPQVAPLMGLYRTRPSLGHTPRVKRNVSYVVDVVVRTHSRYSLYSTKGETLSRRRRMISPHTQKKQMTTRASRWHTNACWFFLVPLYVFVCTSVGFCDPHGKSDQVCSLHHSSAPILASSDSSYRWISLDDSTRFELLHSMELDHE